MLHWRPGWTFYLVVAIVCANIVWGLVAGVRGRDWQHMWMALATVVPLFVVAFLFDWARNAPRARPGHCPRCGYDLTALHNPARCPECGTPTRPAPPG